MNKTRWYYRFPGNFFAHGPTTLLFASERAVRVHLRSVWDLDRLPSGAEVWRASA